MSENAQHEDAAAPKGHALEVFWAALVLGLTSFGGPIAHIGYFERAYVEQRRWLSREAFAELLALCQLVPGPASSQLGFLIGLNRAGWRGAVAAWFGFTLPSALLMFALGFAVRGGLIGNGSATPLLHGLQLVAVPVVAQAGWSMARSLCPDAQRVGIAVVGLVTILLLHSALAQLVALLIGAGFGMLLCRPPSAPLPPRSPSASKGTTIALGGFATMVLIASLIVSRHIMGLSGLMAIFIQSGALVFGGGHVVLPLLRGALVPGGWIDDHAFLIGYGAAQALPGPLLSLAAYLGAVAAPVHASSMTICGWALAALIALFSPGFLVAVGAWSIRNWLSQHTLAARALAGINAAVVGILAAALYAPVATTALLRPIDALIAVAGLILLVRLRAAPILVVALTVAASYAATL